MKILGLADTHVTSNLTMAGCRPTGASGRPLIIEQHERFWRWLANIVREQHIDLVVHAGDVYEEARPSMLAEATLIRGLMEVAEHAPVVLLPGNHDTPNGGGVHALEPIKHIDPSRIAVLDGASPCYLAADGLLRSVALEELASGKPPRATMAVVFPLPYPARTYLAERADSVDDANALISEAAQKLLNAYALIARGLPAKIAKVVAFHGTMSGAGQNEWQTAPAHDIQVNIGGAWNAFDVHVVGHIHLRQDAPGTSLPGYVGSPDIHDFGEEGQAKGVSIFETEPEGTSCRFVPYPGQRRYVTITTFDDATEHDAGGVGRMDYLYPTADGWTDEPAEPDETVYRVKGPVTVLGMQRVARLVASLRARGFIIGNECDLAVANRARIEVTSATDVTAALDASFKAQPDLEPRRDQILARIASIREADRAA